MMLKFFRAGAALSFGAVSTIAMAEGYTIENCGHELQFDTAPQKILAVNTDPIVMLEALGVLDRVVTWTGPLSPEAFSNETLQKIEGLRRIGTQFTYSGGGAIDLETVIDLNPDLVLAPEKAIDRAMLGNVGVPLFASPLYCLDPQQQIAEPASFDLVFEYLRLYGRLLGVPEAAAQAVSRMQIAIERETDAQTSSRGTGLAIFVNDSGIVSAYGNRSMVHPILGGAGLKNVYADVDQRVFKPALEDILARDPDFIVILYDGIDPEDAIGFLRRIPGAEQLKAVHDDRLVALAFALTDPPTPLSVKGMVTLRKALDSLK